MEKCKLAMVQIGNNGIEGAIAPGKVISNLNKEKADIYYYPEDITIAEFEQELKDLDEAYEYGVGVFLPIPDNLKGIVYGENDL